MAIKIFNTKDKKKVVFEPLSSKEVKIYTCGPTLYETPHIGNMRCYIFADSLRKNIRI